MEPRGIVVGVELERFRNVAFLREERMAVRDNNIRRTATRMMQHRVIKSRYCSHCSNLSLTRMLYT